MPISEGLGLAIAGGASLVGTGANIGANAAKNRKQYKWTKELNKWQNEVNIANWNRQNAYNTPQAQMSRMKAAGLNPNLIYQNGGATAVGGDIAAANGTVPEASAPNLSPIADFNNTMQMLTNRDSVQAEIENKQQDTIGKSADNVYKLELSKYAGRQAKEYIRGLELANIETAERTQLLSAQTGLTQAECKTAQLNWSLVPLQMQKLQSEIGLNKKQLQHLDSLITNVNANTDLVTAQYQKAMIEKALEDLRYAAEIKAPESSYDLIIKEAHQRVMDLQFTNSEINRRKQLVPAANVPEQVNIYREYRGLMRLEDQLDYDTKGVTPYKDYRNVRDVLKSLNQYNRSKRKSRIKHF